MLQKLTYLCLCVLILALVGANAALGVTVETRVVDESNDSEEDLNVYNFGDADLGSSDLKAALVGIDGRIVASADDFAPESERERAVKRSNRIGDEMRLSCLLCVASDITVSAPYW